jgi:glutamate decarboxylase
MWVWLGGLQNRNFELPRVKSINVSGHKFGLVYAGLGWIIWRDQAYLPRDLIFELHYLGGTEESFTLNFSRPGAQVVVQYYNLVHLGRAGYRQIMEDSLANARLLSKSLEATGWYECVSDVHRPKGQHVFSTDAQQREFEPEGEKNSAAYNAGLPVVAFRFSDEFRREFPHIKQQSVSDLLRAKQYIIPSKCGACIFHFSSPLSPPRFFLGLPAFPPPCRLLQARLSTGTIYFFKRKENAQK